MPPAPGIRLGVYELAVSIGAGGMGEVFRARDTKLDRAVAIKVLPAAFAAEPERLARFEREAKLLASLNHSNIAHVYGFESATHDDGSRVHFLAMELVEGEDLAQRLKRGAIPVDEAIGIARQIAEALEEAHEKGIVHRDLKPANVKVTPEGKVKVLDFGLAKAFTADPMASSGGHDLSQSPTLASPVTQVGLILGTAAYMSPEQARGKPVDKRADIWAFGVLLFEMLTGRQLFKGETVSDTLAAVLRQPVDWSWVPRELASPHRRLIERCLERDPKRRLRDIGEARLGLEGDPSAEQPGTLRDIAQPGAEVGKAHSRQLVLGVALAVLLVGMGLGRATAPTPSLRTFTPKTFVPQAIFNARFMPDGQTLIVSSALAGNTPSLFESRPDSATPRPFGPKGTHLLSISKASELAVLTGVTYIHQRLMRGTLSRMTLEGAPRAITEDVREADWLPDGSDLVVIRDVDGRDRLEFPMGHVVLQAAGYLSDPRVSPGGALVAFMDHPRRWDDRGLVKVVDRAGVVTTIAGEGTVGEFVAEEGIAWSPDGRSVMFSAWTANGDGLEIFSVPAAGAGVPRRVVSSPGSLQVLDVAPDGRMAVTSDVSRLGVAVRGAGQDAERDFTPLDQAWNPSLSADGQFLAFSDGRSGRDYGVFLRNVDGSPPVVLGEGNTGDISPDGRWVTATLLSSGRCVVHPTGAGTMVKLETGPLQACQEARWFPDGEKLLIVGNEPGKAARGYVAAFPGGRPEALLPIGLMPRALSGSGRKILVQDAARAWQVFEVGGAAALVKGLRADDTVVEWSADERSVVVADTRVIPAVLDRVTLDTGARTKLGALAPEDRAGLLMVLPTAYRDGGRQYAYRYVRNVSTLYVMGTGR